MVDVYAMEFNYISSKTVTGLIHVLRLYETCKSIKSYLSMQDETTTVKRFHGTLQKGAERQTQNPSTSVHVRH